MSGHILLSHTCCDCGTDFMGGGNAKRCPKCRKRHTYEGFYSTGIPGKQGARAKNNLLAVQTRIHTGRMCQVCGCEIVHLQDRDGYPVGSQDYFTCAASECKLSWKRRAEGVAEEFWAFSPQTEANKLWGSTFPGTRSGEFKRRASA
jgi:hypothetical protein